MHLVWQVLVMQMMKEGEVAQEDEWSDSSDGDEPGDEPGAEEMEVDAPFPIAAFEPPPPGACLRGRGSAARRPAQG